MSQFLASFAAIDPIAFRIGIFTVRWYGLAYIFGITFGVAVGYYFLRRWDIDITTDEVLTITMWLTLGIIIGSRLGYALFYGRSYYWLHPLKILAFTDGGMSFHGGLIGILIGGIIASRQVQLPLLTLIDVGSIGAPIGFGLGRITNFINGEIWGRVTQMPWGVIFDRAGPYPRHPTQLYEALLEGLVLFSIMVFLGLRKPPMPRGSLFGSLLLLYGIFRITVEFFREPDAQLGFLAGGWLTMGMLLSIPMIIGGIAMLIWSYRRLHQSVLK